jgi:cytochrome P450
MAHASITLAVAVGGLLLAYYIVQSIVLSIRRLQFARANACKPPPKLEQPGERILGIGLIKENMKRGNEHKFLETAQKRFRDTGNTFSAVVFGDTLYNTCEPDNIKAILATQFKEFGLGVRRWRNFNPLLGNGIFSVDGQQWEHSRAMLRPNFARTQVANLVTFETHINNMIALIPRDGSMVDLQELFFGLTLDSATEFLFGESVHSLLPSSPASNKAFGNAFNESLSWIPKRSRFGRFMWAMSPKEFTDACKTVHAFADQFVQRALAQRNSTDLEKKLEGNKQVRDRYVFLEELAMETGDPIELRDQLLSILLAGRDTTAGTLTILWHTLARRPDILEKLRQEVIDLGGKRPTFESMKNMKYLKNVINEVLRLYPIVPLNARQCFKDTTLPVGGGPDGKSKIFVKKGQVVAYSVYCMHHRKDIYGEDAEEFKPERWENRRPGWEFLPFNGGPRICLGQQFALTEVSYTTIRLLQEFSKIENRDPVFEWVEKLGATMSSLHGCKVGLSN